MHEPKRRNNLFVVLAVGAVVASGWYLMYRHETAAAIGETLDVITPEWVTAAPTR